MLYLDSKDCDRCKEREKIVFGKGLIKSKILFIGEAPTFDDSIVGVPFSDKIGEKFWGITKYLSDKIDLNDSIYYTNLVLCPSIKPVNKEQYTACYERLKEEILYIDPKAIVLLGIGVARFVLEEAPAIVMPKDVRQVRNLARIDNTYFPFYFTHSMIDLYHRGDEIRREVKKDLDFIATDFLELEDE